MKRMVAWIALVLTVVLAAASRGRGQDVGRDGASSVYKTEHEEHVTVERTTTTVRQTTVEHVYKPAYKCAIFVADHAGNVDQKKAVELQDLLTGYASGKGFRIISRDDVLGANGTNADAASNDGTAVRMAQSLGADYVLFCTITSFGTDKQTYRDPAQDINLVSVRHQMRTTFRLVEAADGGAEVAGVAVASIVDRSDPRSGENNRENVIDDLLDADAMNMADMLAQDARTGLIAEAERGGKKQGEVHFTVEANVANLSFPVVAHRADGTYEVMPTQYHPEVIDALVSLDGVVVGSTGTSIAASPGLHKLRIHHALFQDWQAMVNIHEGMKLPVTLELSDEGLQQYGDLSRMFERLQTHAILTDAQAKVLEGKAAELSHSSIRVNMGPNDRGEMDIKDPASDTVIHTSTTQP